jgi:glycosyltransferase involved in cell wall biosynthesis
MKISIGIKALNEAEHIAASIESALAAVAPYGGEVILADSGSTDGTLDIARRYPIRIVQLANLEERCCGAGAQLAFQAAQGEYFYILDGDMVLEPGFVATGIAHLDAHADMAGVGGRVREMNVANAEFAIRAAKLAEQDDYQPGEVDRLDCGGLYRTAAVRQVGYFADRNLHAFEEFELAARLRARGWKLARIDAPAVQHFGHTTEGYRLLLRRIRSGYTGATGEVLRAALGRTHLSLVLRRLGHIRKGVFVIGWWIALIALIVMNVPAVVLLPYRAAPFAWFWWRRRDISLVPYSFLVWNSTALGLVTGFLRKRVPPQTPLAWVDLNG